MSVILGSSFEKFTNRRSSVYGQDFTVDGFLTNNLGNAADITTPPSSGRAQSQILSYITRANYGFQNKYLFTASFRVDGSSKFGENNKFGYFPSFALGWRLSEENFLKGVSFISNAKLRLGYGFTGNQNIPSGRSITLLSSTNGTVINNNITSAFRSSHIPNPNLRWEASEQTNIGLDAGFFNGRINLTFDYFKKNTKDLLLALPVGPYAGHNTFLTNVGKVENKGIEVLLNTVNTSSTNGLNWETTFNFSTVENEVKDLYNVPQILGGNVSFTNNFTITRVGDPIASYYGYEVKGVFQLGDEISLSAQPLSRPGEMKFVDQNDDGIISSDDRVILGSPFPDFNFGLQNMFSYGNFDFSFFIHGSLGHEMFNYERLNSFNPINFWRNRYAEFYTNRWTQENPTTNMTSLLSPEVAYGGSFTNWVVEDASFIRLQNVRLGYKLPTKSKIIRSANLFFSGENLFIITEYTGFDPEVSSLGRSNVRVDYSAYPSSRTYSVGLNIGF